MSNVQELRAEMKRRWTLRNTMLRAFQQNGQLTTKELNRFGTGCSSRLKELRKDGHEILAVYDKPGQWRYVYKGKE